MANIRSILDEANILIEATLTPEIIKKMIEGGRRVSIYYKGDGTTKKGWKQVSVLRTEKKDDTEYLIVRDWGSSDESEIKLIAGLVSNWNVLSTVSKDLDTQIKDSIKNKRVVTIRYKGAEETSVGVRIKIKPVCFGYRANKRKYVRAWQEGGKTVTRVPAWKFFRMDRISGWEVDGTEVFDKPPGPDFNTEGDKMMDGVYAIADFAPDEPGDPTPPSEPKGPKKPPTSKKKAIKKTSSPTSTEPLSKKEVPKKPVKGPARPGATSPERSKKGPARPGATGDSLSESKLVSAILEAVKIL